ncbi:MAG: DUF502 domain-containing protein [Chloroflexi bacterium]|nr:DUF502 domain-containing protein [Chloroflexota bacterium]
MKHKRRLSWSGLSKKLMRQFLAGLFVIVPIGITVLILVWIFNAIDSILQPVIQLIVGHPVPGIGFGVTVVLIYLVGVMASNIGGSRLIHYGESLLSKVPIIGRLYKSIEQIMESFSSSGKSGLMQVVLVEFPRKGMWTIGFITSESPVQPGETHLNIFIPTSPNPTSGFLQIASEDEVIRTDIPVDDALKMIISAGKVSPQEISHKLSQRTK